MASPYFLATHDLTNTPLDDAFTGGTLQVVLTYVSLHRWAVREGNCSEIVKIIINQPRMCQATLAPNHGILTLDS